MTRIKTNRPNRDDLIQWCEHEAENRRPTNLRECRFLHAIAELIRPASPAIPIAQMSE